LVAAALFSEQVDVSQHRFLKRPVSWDLFLGSVLFFGVEW